MRVCYTAVTKNGCLADWLHEDYLLLVRGIKCLDYYGEKMVSF